MWIVFALLSIIVWLTRDRMLVEPGSFLRQRYAPITLLMFGHGIPGAIALILGVFQFSSRLRQRYLNVHRWMGRIYIACATFAGPLGVVVAFKLPLPTLHAASIIQSAGWMLTAYTALYCVRTGRIQQHREWMMRSYPFAMVFVVVRAILAIPAIAQTGLLGVAAVVWSTLATACFLPSFVIAWQSLAASHQTAKARAGAAGYAAVVPFACQHNGGHDILFAGDQALTTDN